jgi:murein DD-endopeptidase MepM/ murein hydrolase activator NlpD
MEAGVVDDGGLSDADPPVVTDAAPDDAGAVVVDAQVDDAGPALCPRLKVTVEAGLELNVRPSASTAMSPVGTLPRGYVVAALDLVHGETVMGEDRWYQIESPRADGYVHYAFVECTDEEVTTTPIGYYMPFSCGFSATVTQGPGGGTSHGGTSRYAWDFGCSLNTSIRAMMAGTVAVVWMETGPGDACYNGGGSECSNVSNHILIHHPSGQTSLYKHLNSASVSVGDSVSQGQEIGLSGTTGWSTGPHLHVGVCDGHTTNQFCQTVDFSYADIGRPDNVRVTSGNCP